MPVLQYYYTSFVNKGTGSAGFQVKAMSPGITREQQQTIARLIAYRIPPSLDERATDSHPVALRYLYKDANECFFLCSQSNGTDEIGRPGNFFAHVLVMEPSSFKNFPPILYWKSDFWCKKDLLPRTQLPVLPHIDEDKQSLHIERIWEFLSSKGRIEQFRKLMCAVVFSSTTQRRIVIIDTDENVALWVAAVSSMLPPDYRPLLSFATYHHDPYQVSFLITGTTRDSLFRATAEEYSVYFILNGETGMVSDVEDSPYANLVARYASPYEYEMNLLSLFSKYAHLFPPSKGIDRQLDSMVVYARLLASEYPVSLALDELQVIGDALGAFEQLQDYTLDDSRELLDLNRFLLAVLNLKRTKEVYELYMRAQAVLIRHFEPAEDNVIDVLKFFTESLVNEEIELGDIVPAFEKFCQLLDQDWLATCVNSQDYLKFLDKLLDGANFRQFWLVWQYLGSYLLPNPYSKNLLLRSVRLYSDLWNSQVDERRLEADKLFTAMKRAMRDQEQNWLQLIVDGNTRLAKQALEDFYCKLVFDIELDHRVGYREIVQRALSDIIVTELRFDIEMEPPKNGLAVLERWSRHMKRFQLEPLSLVVSRGLTWLELKCSDQQWRRLAQQILLSKELAPLPAEVEQKLISDTLSGLSLSTTSLDEIELYKKYYVNLPEQSRIIVDALTAMSSGQLRKELAAYLNAYLDSLPPEQYKVEIQRFISEFLKHSVTKENHDSMVYALFTRKYEEYFWPIYWKTLSAILLNPRWIDHAINLLSYWFHLVPSERHLWRHSIIQGFFLELPDMLNYTGRVKGFEKLSPFIIERIGGQSWYPSISVFLPKHKRGLLGMLQLPGKIASSMLDQKADEGEGAQLSKRKLEAEVVALFKGYRSPEFHRERLANIYSLQQREQFWSCYWKQLEKLLVPTREKEFLEDQADIIFNLLTFWFVKSFDSLAQVPYIIPEFFLGLPRVLDAVRKTEGFGELAREINVINAKQREPYEWCSMPRVFFI